VIINYIVPLPDKQNAAFTIFTISLPSPLPPTPICRYTNIYFLYVSCLVRKTINLRYFTHFFLSVPHTKSILWVWSFPSPSSFYFNESYPSSCEPKTKETRVFSCVCCVWYTKTLSLFLAPLCVNSCPPFSFVHNIIYLSSPTSFRREICFKTHLY